jgi:hypothetical protein
MTSPGYNDAVADLGLIGIPLSIYLHLYHNVLDPVQYRPVKQLALASLFKCSERSIERAIATLLERRYIELGPVRPTEVRVYRLVHSRMP